jgi:hypothetical protein
MDGNDGLADDLAGWGRWLRYAILQVVVRHGVPTVRPDDVLVGLRRVSVAAWNNRWARLLHSAFDTVGAPGA